MTAPAAVEVTEHLVRRLTLRTPLTFDELRARLEAAVPVLDPDQISRMVLEHWSWSAVEQHVAGLAPHAFVRFAAIDSSALFSLAGNDAGRSVAYLMGNHVIAESMARYELQAMLYAPLRILLFEQAGVGFIAIDRPSDLFGSLGDPRVAAVGEGLDQKVAALLAVLGVPAPPALLGDDRPPITKGPA